MDGRRRARSLNSTCSVHSRTQPHPLAGYVANGIPQKTSTEFSSIAVEDYDYTPVQIRWLKHSAPSQLMN